MYQKGREASENLLARLLPHVAETFSDFGGTVSARLQWEHGYEDMNAVIATRHGRFFLKAFPDRNAQSGLTYVANHRQLVSEIANGLDVPRPICPSEHSHPLTSDIRGVPISWYLMEHVDGDTVVDVGVTDEDRLRVVGQMRILHNSAERLENQYDSWAALALPSTWPTRGHLVSDLERDQVRSIVTRVRAIAEADLTTGPVHGSIEPSNLMRRRDLSVALVDFGTTTVAPVIVDFVTFLATCCLDDVRHPDHVLHRYLQWLQAYIESGDSLQPRDIEAVPDLLEATYWSYLLAARLAWNEGDRRSETSWWIRLSTEGLAKLSEVASEVTDISTRLASELRLGGLPG